VTTLVGNQRIVLVVSGQKGMGTNILSVKSGRWKLPAPKSYNPSDLCQWLQYACSRMLLLRRWRSFPLLTDLKILPSAHGEKFQRWWKAVDNCLPPICVFSSGPLRNCLSVAKVIMC